MCPLTFCPDSVLFEHDLQMNFSFCCLNGNDLSPNCLSYPRVADRDLALPFFGPKDFFLRNIFSGVPFTMRPMVILDASLPFPLPDGLNPPLESPFLFPFPLDLPPLPPLPFPLDLPPIRFFYSVKYLPLFLFSDAYSLAIYQDQTLNAKSPRGVDLLYEFSGRRPGLRDLRPSLRPESSYSNFTPLRDLAFSVWSLFIANEEEE